MKKIIIYIAVALALVAYIAILHSQVSNLKEERNRLNTNVETLNMQVEEYQTSEGLNAIKVNELRFTTKELERYRGEDLETINSLKGKNQDLERISKSQIQSIYDLQSRVMDTAIIVNNVIDTVQMIRYNSEWVDLEGIIQDNLFSGVIQTRDSLVYVETVKYRRFWGFLWKTQRVESREQNIVSKNPHTKIASAEFITIE